MIFSTTLSVPAATARASPATVDLVIAHGIIHHVDISFLDGPENEVHVIVRRPGLHQIVPTNEGDIVGNSRTVAVFLWEPVEGPPYQLVVDAWSPDASYAHEIAVDVHVLPREVIAPLREEIPLLRRLTRAVLGGP